MSYDISLTKMDGAVHRFEYHQNADALYKEGHAAGYDLAVENIEEDEPEFLTKKYLLRDIEHLSNHDISKLYKYVRRYLIAEIPGLVDPLERKD